MRNQKRITRLTFDCPSDLHLAIKMKALSENQSVKDYLIETLSKDICENQPHFLDREEFKKTLPKFLEKHKRLMEGLASR